MITPEMIADQPPAQVAQLEWVAEEHGLQPYYVYPDGKKTAVAWAPQPGSQQAFLECPITEVLYEGTRGPGKTDALLMDFAQHCGTDDRSEEMKKAGYPKLRGFGAEWRGVLFRRTYPELEDVINKSKKWFPRMFPGVRFNETKTFWEWPGGERLYFRQFERESDYWKFHGHAYPWIAWEELTTWPDDKCFKSMMSCSRSTVPGMPLKVRATTNPYGIGHNWVKLRYRLPVMEGQVTGDLITDAKDMDGLPEPPRVAIHGYLGENRVLLHAGGDEYIMKLVAAAPNKAAKLAWLFGSWDIVAGGMFDDIWFDARKHVVIPDFEVPSTWRIDRSFDWGSAKPFSVGWWATSDGSDLKLSDGRVISTVRGDLFRIREWYGWNGRPNEGLKLLDHEITEGIIEREIAWGLVGRVHVGVADSAIFDEENGHSVAGGMAANVRVNGQLYRGIRWIGVDKSKGSRKQGWQELRKRLKASIRSGRPREEPGLFVVGAHCEQWLRTVPTLPRSDKDLDDVDTQAEDHAGDETRYRVRHEVKPVKTGATTGHY